MFFYTIYTSTPTSEISKEMVDQITETSMAWNNTHGISGILLCLEDRFFQFLEGEESDVLEIFDKIKEDPRHKDVTPRVRGFSKERVFSEWSMGSWMLSNEDLNGLPALSDLKNYLEDPLNTSLPSSKYASMMKNILDTWIAHEPERAKRLGGKG